MPSNRLALLAILALGYLGLLSTHVSEFATLFALLVEQCVALGVLSFFVPLNIRNNDELTRTIRPDPGGSSSSIQVRANRPQFFHLCNWRCHWNFDFDNCPLLCGDRCIHPNCNNRRRPFREGKSRMVQRQQQSMGEPSEREHYSLYCWMYLQGSA
jgi:hypothetical protein